eukprot:1996550-Pyramimonas_sp.AAC.1
MSLCSSARSAASLFGVSKMGASALDLGSSPHSDVEPLPHAYLRYERLAEPPLRSVSWPLMMAR